MGGGDGDGVRGDSVQLWDTITQVRPVWRECHGIGFRCFAQRTERNGHSISTLPPVVRHDPFMDQRGLGRLGHHIVSRRVALGYRNRTDFADSLRLTVRTLSDIENGIRRASPGTYAMLENKLSWAPGSIDTILAGGEPRDLVVKLRRDRTEPQYDSFSTEALSRTSTEELLLELRRRIIRPGETWDHWDGLEPRGDRRDEG